MSSSNLDPLPEAWSLMVWPSIFAVSSISFLDWWSNMTSRYVQVLQSPSYVALRIKAWWRGEGGPVGCEAEHRVPCLMRPWQAWIKLHVSWGNPTTWVWACSRSARASLLLGVPCALLDLHSHLTIAIGRTEIVAIRQGDHVHISLNDCHN